MKWPLKCTKCGNRDFETDPAETSFDERWYNNDTPLFEIATTDTTRWTRSPKRRISCSLDEVFEKDHGLAKGRVRQECGFNTTCTRCHSPVDLTMYLLLDGTLYIGLVDPGGQEHYLKIDNDHCDLKFEYPADERTYVDFWRLFSTWETLDLLDSAAPLKINT
jgi:hypothetical protein